MKETGPRRSRWKRAASSLLIVVGVALLAWYAYEIWSRQRAQRRALAELSRLELEAASPAEEAPLEPGPPPEPPRRLEIGDPVGRIRVPSTGVDVVAFEGIDAAILRRGAGHFPGTALPGEEGNVAFAAHRDSFFRGLRHIEPGARVVVETPRGDFRYTVTATRVVVPSRVDVVAPHGRDELTLVTCYPFDYIGPAPRRFVVQALREEDTGEDTSPSGSR